MDRKDRKSESQKVRKSESQKDRKSESETDRNKGRNTERQKDRKQKYRETELHKNRKIEEQRDRKTERQKDRKTIGQIVRQKDRRDESKSCKYLALNEYFAESSPSFDVRSSESEAASDLRDRRRNCCSVRISGKTWTLKERDKKIRKRTKKELKMVIPIKKESLKPIKKFDEKT